MSFDGLHVYWGWDQVVQRAERTSPDESFSGVQMVDELSGMGPVGDPWLDATQSYVMFALGEKPRDLYEARR